MSRFVTPGTTRLQISDGDWLQVKKRLTRGEKADAFQRRLMPMPDGSWRVNPTLNGITQVCAYLLDWSLPEYSIKGKSADEVITALNALDDEDFEEIRLAVVAHEAAMQAQRDAEKKTRSGVTRDETTSSSASVADGRPMLSVS